MVEVTYTLDYSIIPYILHWIILIYLCKKPFHYLLTFTLGIYFVAFAYICIDTSAITENYTWFGYVKRASLIIGLLGYFWIYFWNNKASRIVLQWIIAINVFEAGLRALEHIEIVAGILLILVSPFTPQIFINDTDKTLIGKSGNLLQRDRFNYLSVKWYMRGHLIVLGVWYLLSVSFNYYNNALFGVLTCLLPLLLNEYYLNNFINHFNVRAFALIIGAAVESSFDLYWFDKQPFKIIPEDFNIIWRNIIQFIGVSFIVGLCILNDKYRDATLEQKESISLRDHQGIKHTPVPITAEETDGVTTDDDDGDDIINDLKPEDVSLSLMDDQEVMKYNSYRL